MIDLCFPSSTIISRIKSSLFSYSFKHYKEFSIFEYQSNICKQLIGRAVLALLQALCSLSLSLSLKQFKILLHYQKRKKNTQRDNGEGIKNQWVSDYWFAKQQKTMSFRPRMNYEMWLGMSLRHGWIMGVTTFL